MKVDDSGLEPRIEATPGPDPGERSQAAATEVEGRIDVSADTEAHDGSGEGAEPPTPARPRAVGDPLAKQMLKRSLLPSRAAPVQIGRFTVVRKIGQGGMGTVYACYDEQLDRKVAVKVLHAGAADDGDGAAPRLLREAQAMARVSHPGIVTVLEVGSAGRSVYVAMEFIKGVSLEKWAERPRPWRETVATYVQAGRGLAAAHRAGIVHRDFKPQNVMIGDDGVVKVLDFGLARATDEAVAQRAIAAPSRAEAVELMQPLTRTGVRLGTPAYMSPEQYNGETATTASDQFSFCVSLYRALYGQFPFPMDSLYVLQTAVSRGVVAPPPARIAVPQRVHRALLRGLKADPAQRFGSMDALLAALEHEPLKKYRLAAALAITAAVAGSAGLAIAGGDAAAPLCPDARAELATIWGPDAAAELRAAVAARSPADADATLARVVPKLDAYADAWADMRNEACHAHAEGRQSAQLFDLRTACLDQRRASLAATVDVAHGTGGVSLDAAVKAAASLPSLAGCADVELLTAAIAPPEDPELRARVQEHRETLARAEVLEQTGQLDLGLQLVDGVLADAAAIGYAPLVAEANLQLGNLQQWDGAPLKALAAYEQALWSAIEIDHAPVAARASQRRGFVLASQLHQPLRAREGLELTTALNRRVRADVALYAEYLDNTAVVRLGLDDVDGAAQLWQEAIALREANGTLATAAGIGGLYNFALTLQLQARCEEALPLYERVTALSEQTLGAFEPHRPLYEMAIAICLVDLGRPQAARTRMQRLERSLDRFETDRARKYGFYGRGQAELAAGDGAAARAYVTRAIEAVPEQVLPEFWSVVAMAAALEGDAQAVEQARVKASDGLVGGDPRQASSQVVHRNLGKALASLGRHEEAVAVLVKTRDALADATSKVDRLRRDSISLELGKSRTALGQLDAAEQDLAAALAGFAADLSPHSRELADAMLALGELALARRRFDAAATWLGKAEAAYAVNAEPDFPPLTRTRAALARAQALASEPAAG